MKTGDDNLTKMPHVAPLGLAHLLALAAVVGCSPGATTSIKVVVTTDASLVAMLSEIRVVASSPGRRDLTTTFSPPTTTLQWTIRVPGVTSAFPASLTAIGRSGDHDIVSYTALATVDPDHERKVELVLSAKCAGLGAPTCGQEEMCADGACVPRPTIADGKDGGPDIGSIVDAHDANDSGTDVPDIRETDTSAVAEVGSDERDTTETSTGNDGNISDSGEDTRSADATNGADASAHMGTLSLLAGGPGGTFSRDGAGAAARFYRANGIAADGQGNLYVADTASHAIRKIVISSSQVSTLAGKLGAPGNADGRGSSARFSSPRGVAFDGAGNLYVTDSDNSTVRKVVIATGDVSTVAGAPNVAGSADGIGGAARFSEPGGIASDRAGTLFIADYGNRTIRKLIVATGSVSTLAGSAGSTSFATDGIGSSARFDAVVALAIDGDKLYVSDDTGIRQVVVGTGQGTGQVTTLPGTVTHSSGIAADGSGSLYIATYNTIDRLTLATGATVTIAGGVGMAGSMDGAATSARFYGEGGMTLDGSGNLYVTDSGATVRHLAIGAGTVSTLAGAYVKSRSTDGVASSAHFTEPNNAVTDSTGNLYVTDSGSIRRITLQTGEVTTIAGSFESTGSVDGRGTAARFGSLLELAFDGAGNLYIADTYTDTIRKLALATGDVTTLAGMVGTYDFADGVGSAVRFASPSSVAVNAGFLYIADCGNRVIRRMDLTSLEVTTFAGSPKNAGAIDGIGGAARFNCASEPDLQITSGGPGILYTGDDNGTIRKLVIATREVTTIAGTAGTSGTADGIGADAQFSGYSDDLGLPLTWDPTGNLYISDLLNGTIRKLNLSTLEVSTIIGVPRSYGYAVGPLPATLQTATSVAFLSTGQLVIVDSAHYTGGDPALLLATF